MGGKKIKGRGEIETLICGLCNFPSGDLGVTVHAAPILNLRDIGVTLGQGEGCEENTSRLEVPDDRTQTEDECEQAAR